MVRIDKDWLYEQYVILEKSSREIAKDIGCVKSTILRRMGQYGIPRRPLYGEYQRKKHSEFMTGRKLGPERIEEMREISKRNARRGCESNLWKGGPIERFCLECEEIFYVDRNVVEKGSGKFCSKRCSFINKGPTDIEIIMKEWLEEANVTYIEQYLIKMPSAKTIVDFFLPERKICLYCDDEYWHNRPKVLLRDGKQNEELPKMGYEVVRVKGYDIRRDIKSSVECLVGISKGRSDLL